MEVPAHRVDHRIAGEGPLVFKVDVEGAEASVLEGMRGLLVGDFAGICEVEHADFSTLAYLHDRFEVSLVSLDGYRFHPSSDPAHTASAVASRPRAVMKDVLLRPHGTPNWLLMHPARSASPNSGVIPRWTILES